MLSAQDYRLLKQASDQNTHKLCDSPAPAEIWYADQPPRCGGIPRKISIAEFMQIYQSKGGQPFEYTETLWFKPQHKGIQPPKDTKQAYLNDMEKETLFNNTVNDALVICFINPEVGFGVFAREDIPAYSLLAVYAGDFIMNKEKLPNSAYSLDPIVNKPDREGNDNPSGYTVDATCRGGIARFFQHLPYSLDQYRYFTPFSPAIQERILRLRGLSDKTIKQELASFRNDPLALNQSLILTEEKSIKDSIKNFSEYEQMRLSIRRNLAQIPDMASYLDTFIEKLKNELSTPKMTWHLDSVLNCSRKSIASKNIVMGSTVYKGLVVPFFHSIALIQKGDPIGFDYGLGYWTNVGAMPKLFDLSGATKLTGSYLYSRMPYTLDPQTQTMRYMSRQTYFEHQDRQLGIQIKPATRPISFFTIRDLFVKNNLLSSSYSSLPYDNQFMIDLRKQWPRELGIEIKGYYRYPDAHKEEDKYIVDVICSFADMDRYLQVKHLIEQHEIRPTCKLYALTQDIIIQQVNINPAVAQKFIHYLRGMNLKSYFTAPLIVDPKIYAQSKTLEKSLYIHAGDRYEIIPLPQ